MGRSDVCPHAIQYYMCSLYYCIHIAPVLESNIVPIGQNCTVLFCTSRKLFVSREATVCRTLESAFSSPLLGIEDDVDVLDQDAPFWPSTFPGLPCEHSPCPWTSLLCPWAPPPCPGPHPSWALNTMCRPTRWPFSNSTSWGRTAHGWLRRLQGGGGALLATGGCRGGRRSRGLGVCVLAPFCGLGGTGQFRRSP